jgi:RNA polymerase sigma-70 factor, ECF subfamily
MITEIDADVRLRRLMDDHGTQLTRFVQRLSLGHRQTAEDLVQETMVRAWRSMDTLPLEDSSGRRWLFTVARRLVIDEVRRRQVRPVEVAPVDAERCATDDDTSGAAIANHSLREAVGKLSPAHRQVLHEVYFLDRTAEEVATRLGIPLGTVRSRLHYALRSLRAAVVDG